MSINRDMKSYTLQQKKKSRTPSGAEKWEWTDSGSVSVAIYNSGERFVSASVRYKEATHVGLTHSKGVRAGKNRLIRDGAIYNIIDCKPEARLAVLILKVVDTDA